MGDFEDHGSIVEGRAQPVPCYYAFSAAAAAAAAYCYCSVGSVVAAVPRLRAMNNF